MSIRLLLIIFALFIIFIAAGDNPFDLGDGTFKNSGFSKRLEEKLSNPPMMGIGMGAGGSALTGTTIPSGPNPFGGRAPLTTQGGNAPATNLPATTTQSPASSPDQPAPFRNLPSAAAPQSQFLHSFEKGKGFALSDGTPLRYSGPDVYTLDAAGNRLPLADGKYALDDGSPLYVRDGKQQVPPYFLMNQTKHASDKAS